MRLMLQGRSVHYDILGEGKTILFLHGWGAPYQIYQNMMQKLAEQYRILALDFPGFGQSEEPDEAWSVGQYADFVIAFLKAVDEQPEVIMAHSFGGRVTIKLLSERKAACSFVKRIVLMDAAGVKNRKTVRQKWREGTYKIAKKIYAIGIVEKMYPDLLDEMRAKRGSADYNSATPIMRQALVKAIQEDQTDKLKEINVPTLLIWGDNDTATPLWQGKTMEQEIAGAKMVVLKETGHFSFLEKMDEALSAIRKFVI